MTDPIPPFEILKDYTYLVPLGVTIPKGTKALMGDPLEGTLYFEVVGYDRTIDEDHMNHWLTGPIPLTAEETLNLLTSKLKEILEQPPAETAATTIARRCYAGVLEFLESGGTRGLP